MPFISVHTSVALPIEKKDTVTAAIGQALPLITGKREPTLMVEILDAVTMYKGSSREEPCAMVDVRCFRQASFEDNQNFTEAVLKIVEKEIGVPADRIYFNIQEFDVWGSGGTLNR